MEKYNLFDKKILQKGGENLVQCRIYPFESGWGWFDPLFFLRINAFDCGHMMMIGTLLLKRDGFDSAFIFEKFTGALSKGICSWTGVYNSGFHLCFFNFNQVDKTVIFFSIFVEKFKDKTIYILRKEVKAFTMFTLQTVCMLFQWNNFIMFKWHIFSLTSGNCYSRSYISVHQNIAF